MNPKIRELLAKAHAALKAAGIDAATVDPDSPELVPYGVSPEVARLCRKWAKQKRRRRLGRP